MKWKFFLFVFLTSLLFGEEADIERLKKERMEEQSYLDDLKENLENTYNSGRRKELVQEKRELLKERDEILAESKESYAALEEKEKALKNHIFSIEKTKEELARDIEEIEDELDELADLLQENEKQKVMLDNEKKELDKMQRRLGEIRKLRDNLGFEKEEEGEKYEELREKFVELSKKNQSARVALIEKIHEGRDDLAKIEKEYEKLSKKLSFYQNRWEDLRIDQEIAKEKESRALQIVYREIDAIDEELLQTAGKSPSYYAPSKNAYIGLRHVEYKGLGYEKGYSSLDLFVTPEGSWERFQPFFDLRGHIFDDGRLACNAGGGFRILMPSDKWAMGLNAYFDYRQAKTFHPNQVGGGLEILSKYFDIRANGYYPFKNRTSVTGMQEIGFVGNEFILKRKDRAALPHVDLELGFPLYRKCRGSELYFAVGGYRLFSENTDLTNFGGVYGAKGRLKGSLFDVLDLEASVTYDAIFHVRVQGTIGIRIPLGSSKNAREKKNRCTLPRILLTQRVVRDEIIPIERKRVEFAAINPATGLPFQFIFVNNLAIAPGNGTFEMPYFSTALAEANSSPFDIIYVFAGDGTTTNYATGFILQNGQILQGSGEPLMLNCLTVPPFTPGIDPMLTNVAGDAITLASNTRVDGFVLASPTGSGIVGTGLSTAAIQNVDILTPGAAGISLATATGVSFTNSPITGPGTAGISLTGSDQITFLNGAIAMPTAEGIVATGTTNVFVNSAPITGGTNGISLTGCDGFTYTAGGISMHSAEGILAATSDNITIDGSDITGGTSGISLSMGDGFSYANGDISGHTAEGLVALSTDNITMNTANITGGTNGISLTMCDTISLQTGTITTPSMNGLLLSTVSNITTSGIDVVMPTLDGIAGTGVTTGTFQNGVITMPGSDGVTITTGTTLLIDNIDVASSGAFGINLSGVTTYTVQNCDITAPTGNGINLVTATGGTVQDNTVISTSTASGLSGTVIDTITIQRNTISSTGFINVLLIACEDAITINDNMLTTTGVINVATNTNGVDRTLYTANGNTIVGPTFGFFLQNPGGTSQVCFEVVGNTNTAPTGFFLQNLTGAAALYQVESPTGTIGGLPPINGGATFVPAGPITFVLPGTPCP